MMSDSAKRIYDASEADQFFSRLDGAHQEARAAHMYGSGVYLCSDGKVRVTGIGPGKDMPKALRGYVAVLKPKGGWAG